MSVMCLIGGSIWQSTPVLQSLISPWHGEREWQTWSIFNMENWRNRYPMLLGCAFDLNTNATIWKAYIKIIFKIVFYFSILSVCESVQYVHVLVWIFVHHSTWVRARGQLQRSFHSGTDLGLTFRVSSRIGNCFFSWSSLPRPITRF